MSPAKDSERSDGAASNGQGVLSNLPRTRPQRSSVRRAAARKATAAAAAAPETASSPPKRAATTRGSARAHASGASASAQRVRKAGTRATRASASAEPAPRQGFECESERSSGTVHPPGGAELVASVAEILGELTKAGLSTGERLLRDVLARLPLS
jgi:hypothetical protein